jgi:hypothetical protein
MNGATLPPLGTRKASEGFGTCYDCRVHACQIHGDKMGLSVFRCADCLTALGVTTAMTTAAPSAGAAAAIDPAMHQILSHGRGESFRAIAPGVTANTAPLVDEVDREAMRSSLAALGDQLDHRSFDGQSLVQDWYLLTSPGNYRPALGLPAVDELTWQQSMADFSLGEQVLRTAADALNREAERWPLRSPDDMSAYTDLAASALAAAYVARGAQTLNTSPLLLPGGLRLPPIALLLGTTYKNRVSR